MQMNASRGRRIARGALLASTAVSFLPLIQNAGVVSTFAEESPAPDDADWDDESETQLFFDDEEDSDVGEFEGVEERESAVGMKAGEVAELKKQGASTETDSDANDDSSTGEASE